MFCANCGQQLEDSQLFCPKCGTKVQPIESDKETEPKPSEAEPVAAEENLTPNASAKEGAEEVSNTPAPSTDEKEAQPTPFVQPQQEEKPSTNGDAEKGNKKEPPSKSKTTWGWVACFAVAIILSSLISGFWTFLLWTAVCFVIVCAIIGGLNIDLEGPTSSKLFLALCVMFLLNGYISCSNDSDDTSSDNKEHSTQSSESTTENNKTNSATSAEDARLIRMWQGTYKHRNGIPVVTLERDYKATIVMGATVSLRGTWYHFGSDNYLEIKLSNGRVLKFLKDGNAIVNEQGEYFYKR